MKRLKFFDPKCQAMGSYVVKREIHLKRLIDKTNHEKIGIYKLLKDKKLLDSMFMVKPYN